MTRLRGMGYLLKICWSIESKLDRSKRRRCKLACMSLFFTSGQFGEGLIIFDEIQENPKAIASLKYFCENAPEYAVIAAGTLLGVAIHKGVSFPVGKVDTSSCIRTDNHSHAQ